MHGLVLQWAVGFHYSLKAVQAPPVRARATNAAALRGGPCSGSRQWPCSAVAARHTNGRTMPDAQQQQRRRSIPRQGMYGMLAAQAFSNYITRGSLAPLVQFIVADLRMSAAQKALLLGAFFPVFTPCQVFAGPLCQLFGAKRLLSVNLGGMASLLLLMPAFARVGGVGALCVCLAGIGVCQSPLVPAQGQLKRNWLPDGPERVWGQRIIGLGMRVGYPAAASVTPWIAQRFGWRAVPYCLGAPMLVFSTLWHAFAAERPADEPVEPSPAPAPAPAAITTKAAATAAASASSDSGGTSVKKMEWAIFKLPAVLSAVSIHVACNNMGYCFLQWTPTYYNEVLRLTDIAAAKWISFPGTIGIWLPFIIGAWENRLRSSGMALLTLRKLMTLGGAAIQACSCVLFTFARTPLLACLANCGVHVGMCLHGSGWSANYLEVGGPDTALMYSVGNALASIPGLVLPPLGLALHRWSGGSWLPLFGLCAAFTMASGSWFSLVASVRTGRELLVDRDHKHN